MHYVKSYRIVNFHLSEFVSPKITATATRSDFAMFALFPNLSRTPFSISNNHIVPVARLEAFRALKLSRLESFRALKLIGQIGGF